MLLGRLIIILIVLIGINFGLICTVVIEAINKCPSNTSNTNNTSNTSNTSNTTNTSNTSNTSNASDIPIEKQQLRIIGGHKVSSLQKYSYIAAIVIKKQPYIKTDKLKCGASIISKYWLVTAAHCIVILDEYKLIKVIVRTNTLDWKKGIEHQIVKHIKHNKYVVNDHDYDIGLIKVKEPLFRRGSKAHAIKVASTCYRYVTNSSASIAGWGYTNSSRPDVSNKLQAVKVLLLTQGNCKSKYKELDNRKYFMNNVNCNHTREADDDYYYIDDDLDDSEEYYSSSTESENEITERMFCAGSYMGGRDACTFDSGGPLVQDNVLVGIISWGDMDCGSKRFPGVYVRVSYFNSWIHMVLKRYT